MNDSQITAAVKVAPKGANIHICWERPAKMKKKFQSEDFTILKRVDMTLRLCAYDKMQAVQKGRADGSKPAVNAGMPGKVWVTFPWLKRAIKSQKMLLSVKLGMMMGKPFTNTVSDWIMRVDGLEDKVITNIDDWAFMMLGSETKKSEGVMPETFDLTAENVTSITGVDVAAVETIIAAEFAIFKAEAAKAAKKAAEDEAETA